MSTYGTAPLGHIRFQVGLSISAIRENIEQQDTNGVVNHLRFLIAIAAPKLPEADRARLKVPALPNPRDDRTGAGEAQVFEECMVILEKVLALLSAAGLYAWIEPDAGDARGLALRDDDGGIA